MVLGRKRSIQLINRIIKKNLFKVMLTVLGRKRSIQLIKSHSKRGFPTGMVDIKKKTYYNHD